MASGDQREAIEAIFAGLIGRGEIDVAPAEEGSGLEIRADQWTLAIEGDPVTVAFLAVDDEPGDPASLGQALETAFVGAYMGAVTALKSNELKGVAAQIGANESRHLSVLTNIAAGAIVPASALPKVFTAAQATTAVKPFLA